MLTGQTVTLHGMGFYMVPRVVTPLFDNATLVSCFLETGHPIVNTNVLHATRVIVFLLLHMSMYIVYDITL